LKVSRDCKRLLTMPLSNI